MGDSPWLEHLARTQSPPPKVVIAPAHAPKSAQAASLAASMPAPDALTTPRLQQLLHERTELEQRMRSMVQGDGPSTDDPRYHVASMAERRAELQAWATRRDRARADVLARKDAAVDELPLRKTAADAIDESGQQFRAKEVDAVLPRARRSAASTEEQAPENAYDRLNARLQRARARLRSQNQADALDELLDQRLERALEKLRQKMDVANEPGLNAVEDFLPQQWRQRGENLFVPGRPDPYTRELKKKLAVDVGDLETLGERFDRLRQQAQTARELVLAEREQDEQRRQRALDKLRARKQEEQEQEKRREQKRADEEWPSDKRRREREEAF